MAGSYVWLRTKHTGGVAEKNLHKIVDTITTGGAVASGLIIAAGGVTILNKLRNYKVIEHRSGHLVIKRS